MGFRTKVEQLKKGDLVWVDVPFQDRHPAIVLNDCTRRARGIGDDKWNVRCCTITHGEHLSDTDCKIELDCDIVPDLFGTSCNENNSNIYVRTDNLILLRKLESVDKVGNIAKHEDFLVEICSLVHECLRQQQRKSHLMEICDCEELEKVDICIEYCPCYDEDEENSEPDCQVSDNIIENISDVNLGSQALSNNGFYF